jgi:hypothetical protein
VVDAGQDVVQRPRVGSRKADATRGHHRHPEGRAQIDERCQVGLIVPAEMTLELDPQIVATEHPDQSIDQSADTVTSRLECLASDERDQAG